jgi:hypothetical protein
MLASAHEPPRFAIIGPLLTAIARRVGSDVPPGGTNEPIGAFGPPESPAGVSDAVERYTSRKMHSPGHSSAASMTASI